MANETTSTTLAGSLPRLVVGGVVEAHNNLVIFPRIRASTLGQGQGTTGRYSIMSTLAVADVTEGTDMSNTAVSHAAIDITVAQRGIKVSITDVASRGSAFGLEGVLQNVIRQVTQDVDAKIAALFAGFTTNNVAASTMTSSLLFQALGKVLAGTGNMALNSPDITAALHTTQYTSLNDDLAANGTPLSDTPIMQGVAAGTLKSLYGIALAPTGMVPVAASSGTKSGALFFRDALGAVVQWATRPVTLVHPDVGGGPGVIASVTHSTGFAELVDAYGCQIESD